MADGKGARGDHGEVAGNQRASASSSGGNHGSSPKPQPPGTLAGATQQGQVSQTWRGGAMDGVHVRALLNDNMLRIAKLSRPGLNSGGSIPDDNARSTPTISLIIRNR